MILKPLSVSLVRLLIALSLLTLTVASSAQAATYSDLTRQGYRIGPLTQSRGGAPGWILSGGGKRYFCRLGVSMVLSGENGMVSITSSGRRIKADKAAYEAFRGGPNPNLPRLEDLEAGRPRPQDVGICTIY
jgi:hypothetical protein